MGWSSVRAEAEREEAVGAEAAGGGEDKIRAAFSCC